MSSVVNSWQKAPFSPTGYVQQSDDWLCEPHFQPSPALPGLLAYAQDYLGAGFSHSATKMKVDAEHPARRPEPPGCCCNIGEMARKVSVKCAIAGCHYQRKMTLAEREELRRVGRENHATAGLVCPAHVKAVFNFEFDDIDIDVPLGELLVETSKETPRWRVMLTPLPGAAGEPDNESTPGRGDRVI